MPFDPGKFSDQLGLGSSDWLVANVHIGNADSCVAEKN
jgi:hypothetical protein